MKVYIDYKLNESGKSKFLQRLIPALAKIGVECSFKQKGCDVALGISKWRSMTTLKKVLRVDGIHLAKGKKEAWRNEQIRKSIKKSDTVIFQSEFAKKTIVKKLKVKPKCYVIHNGANPDDYNIEKLKLPHTRNILMCARWANRKTKRLKAHLDYLDTHEEHFYLAGEHPPIRPRANLTDLGHLPDDELRKYQASCDQLLYLTKVEWCPNAVVEAIVAGLPVTHLAECEAVEELCNFPREHFFIDNIARKYKRVFKA